MKIFTKNTLIIELKTISKRGWIENARQGNAGGVGNTLEDLLEIDENNLPIPNAAEWELKCKRTGSSSLTTLFHMEPSPRSLKFVPSILLPSYGWLHQGAGEKYGKDEMSFRQTINTKTRSDRGFKVEVNKNEKKVMISFDASSVSLKHKEWLNAVKNRIGLNELNPQPYWGFDDLYHKAATKLINCFFVEADTKREGGKEYFNYQKIKQLSGFSLDKWIMEIEKGNIYVDFDARTGHNHGTKFRLRQNHFVHLYENVVEII